MNEITFYSVVAIAIVAICYAFLTRKQLSTQKALAEEAAAKVEREDKKLSKLESSNRNLQQSLEQLKASQKGFDKKTDEFKRKLTEKEKQLELAEQDKQASLVHQGRQLDHLQEQAQALTSQLSQAVREKKEISDELRKMKADAKSISEKDLKEFKADQEKSQKLISQLRKEKKTLNNEVERAREVLSKVNPGEIKRIKIKLSRLEQLYRSMKGLREMAEERNHNWETALRILSVHIVGDGGVSLATGPLVGQALEQIGAHLVIDEHTDGGQTENSNQKGTDGHENNSTQQQPVELSEPSDENSDEQSSLLSANPNSEQSTQV